MELLISAVVGYLLGSIPFGLILTKLAGHGDIRAIGSGNIGATNVLRTGNKKLAALTLLLDMAKGAVAVFLISFVFPETKCAWPAGEIPPCRILASLYGPSLSGFFALLGHIFPVWLKFKGGKGVATGLGIMLALYWPVGVLAALTWIATAFLFRISSLSALVAVSLAPVYAFAAYFFLFDPTSEPIGKAVVSPLLPWLTLACSVLIIAKHHANIRRLIKGEEPKIGKKKDATDEQA